MASFLTPTSSGLILHLTKGEAEGLAKLAKIGADIALSSPENGRVHIGSPMQVGAANTAYEALTKALKTVSR